jgi:16S rRNA processing protein RimM
MVVSKHGEDLSGTPAGAEEFVTIAQVIKTQGRNGEVAARLFTDFPERFATRKQLFALDTAGRRRELELQDHWFHKDHVVLKFKEVDSITDAETLIGSEIQIPRSQRASLQADEIYVSDLTGCRVYDSGREIGTIEDIRFDAGEAPLLIVKGDKEYLLPFVAAYIEKIAIGQKRVEMKLPQGLLELDAPLTREERERQNRSG